MSGSTKVLVTGAAGHLGSHLAPALAQQGFEVTGLDVTEPLSALSCPFARCDLADADAIGAAVAGQDMVVHCASIHPWKPYTDDQYFDANVKGNWHLYAAAAAAGVDRVVLTSSIAATGYAHVPPDAWPVPESREFPISDLYSHTKQVQELAARVFADKQGIRTLALRPPPFMPKPPLETGFQLTGVFALVEDMVSAHVAAVRLLAEGGEPLDRLQRFEPLNVTNRLPYVSADAGLDPAERVGKYWPEARNWLVERGYRGGGLTTVYDLSRARDILGWEPRHNFGEWFAENHDRL